MGAFCLFLVIQTYLYKLDKDTCAAELVELHGMNDEQFEMINALSDEIDEQKRQLDLAKEKLFDCQRYMANMAAREE